MLVLSRKRGEAITIGSGVTITVLAVHGDKVKIGILARLKCPSIGRRSTSGSRAVLPRPTMPGVRRYTLWGGEVLRFGCVCRIMLVDVA